MAGYHDNPNGDIRVLNNVFAGHSDVTQFNQTRLPMHLEGNVFVGNAKPCTQEQAPLLRPEFDPKVELREKGDGFSLEITLDADWVRQQRRGLVTSETLGIAVIPSLPFERADGTHVRIDSDFSGRLRDVANPFPGPFECLAGGRQAFRVS